MYAPNGFYRSFTGAADSGLPEAKLEYDVSGNLIVHVRNPGSQSIDVSVVDNAYGAPTQRKQVEAAGEASVRLNLQRSHGWCDFTVKTGGSEAEARFAGRIETGKASFTDPLMGGMI